MLGFALPGVIGQPRAQLADQLGVDAGRQILPIDQVRAGMKGYGLTVFQGTRVEPFTVEVLSVTRDFEPKRGVIWIRCPEARMKKLGPVQGMSGSPIYLWTDDEPHEPGRGGKLIGAYAYGFSAVTDCIIGVQPIELMLEAADRAQSQTPENQEARNRGSSGIDQAAGTLRQMLAMADQKGRPSTDSWRARLVLRLMENDPGGHAIKELSPATFQPSPGFESSGQGQQISLTMGVHSAKTAAVLAPLLDPIGITPIPWAMGSGDIVAGKPPPGIDPKAIELEPGGVLSVPLAYGDKDLSAVGTITDVLPDGRVLAFGHSLFGQGSIAVPMASGYVNLIMPNLLSSFKLGGSGAIRGSIVRDEHSALIGTPENRYTTSPVEIVVDLPDQPTREYRYEVAHHKHLTPLITSVLVMDSLTAISSLPIENTMRLQGKLVFTGNRVMELDSVTDESTGFSIMMELFPVISAMMYNPHESLMLEAMEVKAQVEARSRAGSIMNAQIDRSEVAPGDTIGITLHVQPYGDEPIKQRIELEVPASAPEGDYELVLCDAATYADLLFETHPHLLRTTNADDFQAVIQRLLEVSNDALYVILQWPDPGLAIGRQELPRLPSSRRAILETQANTLATPYREWVEKVVPMDMVLKGVLRFTVEVH